MPSFIGRRRALLGGGRRSYSANLQQFYDRLLTPPDATWDARYRAFIDGCVGDGIWAGMDCLGVFSAVDQQTALVDIVSGNSWWEDAVAAGGAPTWVANVGYTGVATAGASNSYDVTTGGLNFTQASASVFCFANASTQASQAVWQRYVGAALLTDIELFPRQITANNCFSSLNHAEINIGANTFQVGKRFYLANQVSGVYKLYQDGVQVYSASQTPSAPIAGRIMFKGYPGVAVAGFGRGFTPTEVAALSSRVATLMTSLGVLP